MKHLSTCPWWLAPTFDNPLRSLVQKPEVILGDLVSPGQTVFDLGCGMGYFSVALAKMVAPDLLKPEGKFLLVESRLHVSSTAFVKTTQIARSVGLVYFQTRQVPLSLAVLLTKSVGA